MFKAFTLYKGHLKNSKKIIIFSSIGLIIALTLISSSLYFIDNSEYQLIHQTLNENSFQGNDILINADKNFSSSGFTTDKNFITNSVSNIVNKYNFNFINKSETKVDAGYVGLFANLPITNKNNFGSFPSQITNLISQVLIIQLNSRLKQELIKYKSATFKNKSIIFPQTSGNLTSSNLEAYALYLDVNPFYTFRNDSLIKNGNFTVYDGLSENDTYNFNITDYNIYSPFNQQTQIFFNPNNFQQHYIFEPTFHTNYPYLYSLLNFAYTPQNFYQIPTPNNLTTQTPQITTILFVPNLTSVGNLLLKNSHNSSFDVNIQYLIHIGFDYSTINSNSISNFITKQNYFSNTLLSQLNNQNFNDVYLTFQTLNDFYYIQQEIQSVQAKFLIIDLPILILSLFLAHYAFGLVYNNIVRNISIYKTRGTSAWIIFSFQIIDTILIICISIFSSLLLGIPLSILSLNSNYLLSFNNSSPPVYLFNFQSITYILFLWAIFLIIIINLNRMRKLSKMPITEAENLHEQGNPFWKKHYLDIILMAFGLVMFGLYYLIIHNTVTLQNLSPVLLILEFLILPSPFAFIIGLILFISRFVPILLNKISSILWFNTGGLTAYSFKNILRYKNATIRAILLTATVMSFLLFFYSQPYTLLVNHEQTAYYQSGSDATLSFQNGSIDLSTIKLLQNSYSQYIESLCPFVLLNAYLGFNSQMTFLLVNTSSYIQSSNLNFDLGLKNTLKADFANLKEPANSTNLTPIGILLDQNAVNQRNAQIGDNITVTSGDSNTAIPPLQRFKIIDSFTHWPFVNYGAYPTTNNQGNFNTYQNYYAIGDINYFLNTLHGNITNTIFSNINEAGLFINFKQNINVTQAVFQIENHAQVNFQFVPQLDIQQYVSTFSFLSETGQINLNILISLLVIVIILVLFIQFQFAERNREIYTERAIGMKLNQIAYIFYIENMVLIATSLVVGFVVGVLLVNLLSILTANPNQSYPPNSIVIPYNLVIWTNLVVFVLAGIISIIPTLFVVKKDISDSFAREF